MSEEKQKPCDLEDHDAKGTTNIRTVNKYKQTSYQTASVNDPVCIYSVNERAIPAATEAAAAHTHTET